jgi:hypothetical protein
VKAHIRRRPRLVLLALAAAALLTATATAAAGQNTYAFRSTPDGQAAARAATLSVLDLGTGWKVHSEKPDLTVDLRCPYFHPKVSDLVVNGAVSTRFEQTGLVVHSEAEVLQTAKMVQTDFARSVGSEAWLRCTRESVRKHPGAHSKLVSLRTLKLPDSLGAYAKAYRMRIDVTTKSGRVPLAADIIVIARGRAEITLDTTMLLSSVPTLYPNEVVWARMLVGRARM